jgi:hypothetical protein
MIDRDTAHDIALAEIQWASRCRGEPFECVILDQCTREEDFGWVFFFQSRKYMETQVLSWALAGNGPIIVMREDGEVHRLGSADPPKQSIAEFRRQFVRRNKA